MNMTLDGFCDHTAMVADDEIHQHYTDLLNDADSVIYGRKTFQLMEFWPPIVENPTGNKAMDDFAIAMDDIHKIVYSRTLEKVDWKTTELKRETIQRRNIRSQAASGQGHFCWQPKYDRAYNATWPDR